MTTSSVTIQHVRVETEKEFTKVTERFEQQLGRFDPELLKSLRSNPKNVDAIRSQIEAMAGTSGLMLFGTTDHGALLSAFGNEKKAIQYVVGSPLIAMQMTQHNVAAGLYAPLRVLIYENERGQTCLEYDQPSSLFGQFNHEQVTAVGRMLDGKLDDLIARAIS
jgi:uncharacterized protein (DUF302 family)